MQGMRGIMGVKIAFLRLFIGCLTDTGYGKIIRCPLLHNSLITSLLHKVCL